MLELGLMKFFVKPKPPFNFELITSLYSRFPVQCVDLYSRGVYERVLRDEDKLFLVRANSVGTIEKPKLQVEVFPKGVRKKFITTASSRILQASMPGDEAQSRRSRDRNAAYRSLSAKPNLSFGLPKETPSLSTRGGFIEDKIKWILGTDDELKGFYKITQKEERLAPIIKNLYGLRAPKTPTVYEALIIALTEQQIAFRVALSLRKKLVEQYGESLGFEGEKYFAFPEPEALAQAKPKEIRKLGLSIRKAEYIINVSQKVAQGKLDLEKMKNWEMKRVLETLTKIRGLGPWTVEYMMCRGMGRYEALPANDMGLRISLTKFLDKKERVSEKEVRKFLDHFGEHKGYAAFYLIYAYAFQKYPQERLLSA